MAEARYYQLLPDLAPDEFVALKADIAAHGVQVAVEVDEHGAILDGHHRVQAWTELRDEGVAVPDYPTIVRAGLSEAEKRAQVRRLNLLRRHLSREQRRELIADQLREDPDQSARAIGETLGVHHSTVEAVRNELELTGEISQSDARTGRDGRTINTANIGRRTEPDALRTFDDVEPTQRSWQPRTGDAYRPDAGVLSLAQGADALEPEAAPSPLSLPGETPAETSARLLGNLEDTDGEVAAAKLKAAYARGVHLTHSHLLMLNAEMVAATFSRPDARSALGFIRDARAWFDRLEDAINQPVLRVIGESVD